MKKKNNKHLLLGIAGVVVLLLSLLKIRAAIRYSRDISYIGGADGPTSILLVDRSLVPVYIIALIFIVIVLILFFVFKRKK